MAASIAREHLGCGEKSLLKTELTNFLRIALLIYETKTERKYDSCIEFFITTASQSEDEAFFTRS